MRLKTLVSVLVCSALFFSCVSKGIYVKPNLEKTYPVSLDRVCDATIEALDELDLKVVNQPEKDKIQAEINAALADGTDIKIILKARENETYMTVRVGIAGDEEASRRIMKAINKHVNALTEEKAAASAETPPAP